MSLQVLNTPTGSSEEISAVANPVIWDVQSDRVADVTATVSSISDNGGFAKYTFSAAHPFQIGDIVKGTDISSDYNVLQTVTALNGNTATTDLAYVDNKTGTLQRDNNNFRMKADVYKGVGDYHTISSTATASGKTKYTLSAAPSGIAVGDSVIVSDSDKSYTPTSIYDDGTGKTGYTIGTHVLTAGDIVYITNVDIATPYYNTYQKIISVTATTIVTDLDVSTTGTPATGTITAKLHDGLQTVTAVSGSDVTTDATYVDNVAGYMIEATLIGSKKAQQITDGSDNLFRFNLSNFLSSELSFDLVNLGTATSIIDTTNSITTYGVIFTERFEDKDGALTSGDSIASDVREKACNASLQHVEEQDLSDFTVDSTAKRFLSNTTTDMKKYVAGDMIQLSFLYTEANTIDAQIQEYDDDLNLTTAIWSPGAVTVTADRGVLVIDTSDFQSDTTTVTVKLKNGGGSVRSENWGLILDTKCYEREVKVHWLNRLGGFDFYRFTGDRTNTIRSNKTTYMKPYPNNFVVSDRQDTVLGVESYEEVEIYSDWVQEADADWLAEVVSSPVVYVEETARGSNSYVPILVTSSSMVMSQSRNMVQFKLSYKRPDFRVYA